MQPSPWLCFVFILLLATFAVLPPGVQGSCQCSDFASCSSGTDYCVDGGVFFGKVCYNTNLKCDIERACQNTVCNAINHFEQYGCEAYAEAVGNSHPAIRQSLLANGYAEATPLPHWYQKALACRVPSLNLNDITVYWGVTSLNHLKFGFQGFSIGFPVAAMTFGNDILVANQMPTLYHDQQAQLQVFAHELQHTMQTNMLGSVKAFGVKYQRALCDVGFTYANNPYEISANHFENSFDACIDTSVTFCWREAESNTFVGALWDSTLNRYTLVPTARCDDTSTWKDLGAGCFEHAKYAGYVGSEGTTDVTLKTACQTLYSATNVAHENCIKDAGGHMISYSSTLKRYALSTSSCTGWKFLPANAASTKGFGLTQSDTTWNWCNTTTCDKHTTTTTFEAPPTPPDNGNGGGGSTKANGVSTLMPRHVLLFVVAALMFTCAVLAA